MAGSSVVSRIRRVGVSAVVVVLASAGLASVAVPSAYAASQLACSGGGGVTIDRQLDGSYKWALSGVATCDNPDGRPVRQAVLTGLATTQGLGACSGADLVEAFSMNVAVTFTSFSPVTGTSTTIQHEVWSLPATAFPVVTPFTVTEQGGGTLGAGEISTHVLAKCPPDGQPSMQVAWVQADT